MIYEHDLQELMTQWNSRIKSQEYDPSYCDAINDCVYDLKNLISNLSQEEAEVCDPFANMSEEELKEVFEDMQANDYLMSEHYF